MAPKPVVQQVDFTRRFGVLEPHMRQLSRLAGHSDILIVSHVLDDQGQAIGTQDAGRSARTHRKNWRIMSPVPVSVWSRDARKSWPHGARTTVRYDRRQSIFPGVRFLCVATSGNVRWHMCECSTFRWVDLPVDDSLDWSGGIQEM